ncbi:hydrogenase-3 nickel incorporation protein HypA [Lacrimispora xylanisolvens]|jgi:hydrogenase nickel incorporation protein HypA/HybF|uniref:Hydrogenase maturation factor HypA n=1 Tax=Lacrimispora xylanisolvens TaxID=384636 RepID=A0A2S6HNI4_9FIRM|nr:hydrogenase maturation nickel metallochaperone HypA [Hungatella xylanolytica]MBE5987378.1 hydrogenase maturation nickel metallochaperone HypA [Paenibacillaceae bacterium]PPK78923.1 hydrogenase-3 nickel incorporation protein HypA [Hungatella xylanolytica]
MHELGVMTEVVRIVENVVREQNLTQVESLVLQIGEMASVIPYYVEQCYPAAVNGTILENTRLTIEILPASGRCSTCNKMFHVTEDYYKCPFCQSFSWELLEGREFLIKEIVAF